DRCVLVKNRIGSVTTRARADDARSRRLDKRLAASRQRAQQSDGGALVIGARGVDDGVGGLRRLRQSVLVIQRSKYGPDAERADGIGLCRGANEAGDTMSGGD